MHRIDAYGHCPVGASKPFTSLIGMIGIIRRDGVSGPKESVLTPGSVFWT